MFRLDECCPSQGNSSFVISFPYALIPSHLAIFLPTMFPLQRCKHFEIGGDLKKK